MSLRTKSIDHRVVVMRRCALAYSPDMVVKLQHREKRLEINSIE